MKVLGFVLFVFVAIECGAAEDLDSLSGKHLIVGGGHVSRRKL